MLEWHGHTAILFPTSSCENNTFDKKFIWTYILLKYSFLFIDPSVTAATCSKSKSLTQTLHQRLSSSNEEDEDTCKDQDDDAFDSECEEQLHFNEFSFKNKRLFS